jgi:hypothetical protein
LPEALKELICLSGNVFINPRIIGGLSED